MTFVGIYLQDEAATFSPFDDISYYHATPSVGLAVEEIFEVSSPNSNLSILRRLRCSFRCQTAVWTVIGVTYLTFAELDIKDAKREAALLKEVGV